jgi:septum formation protein
MKATPTTALILASASPRRATLLREAGYAFTVHVPNVTEWMPGHLEAAALCRENARLKADCIASMHEDALVLGCDTIVCVDEDVLGKPKDRAQAHGFLMRLQGRKHEVMSGVALICRQRDIEVLFQVSTQVVFLPLSAQQADAYLDRVDVMDKAGAYAAQTCGDMIIDRIDGSLSNVVGLPMEDLQLQLAQLF